MAGLGAMPRSAITPGVGGDAFAAVEYFDGAGSGAGIHLLADQRMRHRIQKALNLDVVVDADAGDAPLGILIILLGQRLHGGPFDRLV